MKRFILKIYKKFESIINYLFFSVLATILDVAVVWVLFHAFSVSLAVSNTAGVIAGFILDYILSSRLVFRAKYGVAEFLVYLVTFVLGLFLANFLITSFYDLLLPVAPEWLAFFGSKGVSIVLPFFALYFARKYLYIWVNKRRGTSDGK